MMKPIYYTRDQVALMLRVRLLYCPGSRHRFGVSPARLARIASGRALPPPSVLCELDLTFSPLVPEAGYKWNPF